MLTIRLARAGRKGRPFYHIVLTESTKPPQSGYQQKLGWYDPIQKKQEIDIDTIRIKCSQGAHLSPTLQKLITRSGLQL